MHKKSVDIPVALIILAMICIIAALTLVSSPEIFGINIFTADKIGVKLMLVGTVMFPIGIVSLIIREANSLS